jgi:hypothetical protein
MKWAALITWVVTAGGGFVLLGLWLRGGGMSQAGRSGAIRPPLILTHFLLAASGLVLWIIYVASDSDALAWIAFALLVVVALLGFTMLAIWLQQRRAEAGAASSPGSGAAGAGSSAIQAAERSFPIPVVAAHGIVAAATLVLVLLAAAGVGGS